MTTGAVDPRDPGRDDLSKAARRGRRRLRSLGLLVLALAGSAAMPAPARAASAITRVGDGAAESAGTRAPRGRRSGLGGRVATLTRALGLDTEQQAAVRKVLQDQRQQVQQIWNGEAPSAADRIAATRKLSRSTADRIRAILNEEQRKKFDPPRQDDPGKTIGGLHVEDWMKGETKR